MATPAYEAYTSDFFVAELISVESATIGEMFQFSDTDPYANSAVSPVWTFNGSFFEASLPPGTTCTGVGQPNNCCTGVGTYDCSGFNFGNSSGSGYFLVGPEGPCLTTGPTPWELDFYDSGNTGTLTDTFPNSFLVARDPSSSPLAITSPPALPSPQATPTFAMNATDGNANYTAVKVPVSAAVNDPADSSPHTIEWKEQTVYNTSGGSTDTSYYLDTDNLPPAELLYGTSGLNQNIIWQGLGGLVELTARANFGEGTDGFGTVKDCANIFGVTGASMGTDAESTVTNELIADYNFGDGVGATSDLMTGVAAIESQYQQFEYPGPWPTKKSGPESLEFDFQPDGPGTPGYNIFPYGLPITADTAAWWPIESHGTGGTFIGMMQLGHDQWRLGTGGYLDAWDWTANASDAIDFFIVQKLDNFAESWEARADASYEGLNKQPLTPYQLEDNALVFYNGEGLHFVDGSLVQQLHWVPACSTTATKKGGVHVCPTGWHWKEKSPTYSGAVRYSYCTRFCSSQPNDHGGGGQLANCLTHPPTQYCVKHDPAFHPGFR